MPSPQRAHQVLDLEKHRNNVGCALPGMALGEGFDGFGRTFPAEELADLAPLVGGWPDQWGAGAADNVECDGQELTVVGSFDLHAVELLGASCGGHLRDELTLRDDRQQSEFTVLFGFPDFLAGGETDGGATCVFSGSVLRQEGRGIAGPRPRIWRCVVWLDTPLPCTSLILPLNPGLHVFGIRLTGTPAQGRSRAGWTR